MRFAGSSQDEQALELTVAGGTVPIDCLWNRGDGGKGSRNPDPDWAEWLDRGNRHVVATAEPKPGRKVKMQLAEQSAEYFRAAAFAVQVADVFPERGGIEVARRCVQAAEARLHELEAFSEQSLMLRTPAG